MFWINSSGWYRVAKYEGTGLAEAQGSRGNSTLFSLKSTYNNVENMSVYGTLNCSYARSNIVILSSSIAHPVVSKIRHTVDTKNSVTYLEIYYSTNSSNAISLELTNNKVESNVWRILDIPELTQETTENISVYSNADLIAKERNVIVNSDLANLSTSINNTLSFEVVGKMVFINGYVTGLSITPEGVNIGSLPSGVPIPKNTIRENCNVGANAYDVGSQGYFTISDTGTITVKCASGKTASAFYVSCSYVGK